ncbi:hypothetical protein [Psychromonas hadalis]|uniref:hypothetical protein n=1 Tax=Psychromonas hadalis TaxID=211669 RepID=UPI0003B73787|nr:hypothetical protein [Psychromonas hadalis]
MALCALKIGLLLTVFTVWLPSTFSIVEYRIMIERPWLRMPAIMVAVMMFNLFAAWCVSDLFLRREKS